MLDVCLLGKFEVRRAGKLVGIPSRPAQSLFAYLILNAGTSYRREKLAGMLWPDSTEEGARDYLRHAVWRIRKALQAASAAACLVADDLTLAFNASSDYWLDAAALRELSERAPVDEMMEVLSGYRGELLPGFYEDWVVLGREHLQAMYDQRMGRLMELLEGSGLWNDVLEWGEKWIALGQKPEAAYRAVMNAHAANGDMSKVAVVYERCVRALAEFGVEPSDQTRRLYENLKAGKEKPEVRQVAAPRRPSSKLPVPLTSFIGREKELREILGLLKRSRLLTLIGPGGVGKTRIAIECSNRLLGQFQGGVWWIDLVGLRDPALVPQAVAQATGVHEVPSQAILDTLIEHFAPKQILLVLDNCEHLINICAQMAARLVSACKDLRILATSREALDILGETTWTVPSLSLPDMHGSPATNIPAKAESVHLFLERADSAQPGFGLTDENARAVMQICNRLGGIPLAIELAAARVRMMSVEEIATRLNESFDLLTTGSRTALPRHQTLRATIDWSFDLLSDDERILFRRLSVFAGGFTLEAAEAVAGGEDLEGSQIIDILGRLINKSLVRVQPASEIPQGTTRYHMLETIREYARRRLDTAEEASSTCDRHLEFFARYAEETDVKLNTAQQSVWFERLEADVANLRSAMTWSMAQGDSGNGHAARDRIQLGLRLAGTLAYFWERNYRREAIERLILMLSKSSVRSVGRAKSLMVLGFLHWASTEQKEARPYLEQAWTLAKELGDKKTWSWAMGYLGAVLIALGEYDAARHYLVEAREIGKSISGPGHSVVIWALAFLGDIPLAKGENEAARQLYLESGTLAAQAGEINSMTYSYRRLGYLALQEGQYESAEEFFAESLKKNQQIEHLQGINRCIAAFACLRAAQGESTQAIELCAAVEAFLARMSASLFDWDEALFKRVLSKLREDVPQPTFARAWARGFKLTLDQAVELALSSHA